MRRDPFIPVLLCFFLSGFAGLVFETLWTRQFALVFGTSELAVATVLAAYMGGLAVGAAAARRWVLRTTRPILLYGLLELGIGLGALAVPAAIGAAQALSVALFGGQPAPPDASQTGLAFFTLASSFAILLVPTAFMGATLPLLTRFAVQREDQIGTRVAVLYAVNTGGAVLGTLTAAFVLLPRLSLWHTTWVGVALNFVVFLLAAATARAAGPSPAAAPQAARRTPRSREGWVLPLVLLAGVSSFTTEVLWTRLLSHILGGTVYAFGTMLASFLTGIALGSAAASRIAHTRARALLAFPVSQLAAGLASLAAFLAVEQLPDVALRLGAGGGGGMLPNVALGALVLLPAALFIGASFPLAVRILARDDVDAGPASARVYAWNTVGAIAGSIGAGFFWIPALGYHGALTGAVVLNLLIAGAATLRAETQRPALLSAAAAVLVALLVVRPSPPWRVLSVSALEVAAGTPSRPADPDRVAYFAAGRSSTVMLQVSAEGSYQLLTNGLPEAGVRLEGDPLLETTASWLVALPLLARPDARSLLQIGFGAGTGLEGVPASIESIDAIELEEEVIAANRSVSDIRASDPLADPRVRVAVNDARGALALTTRRWDVIVSQPSHPWTAGASHLFTREFFAQARHHLEPGGVFCQWLAPAFMDEALLRSLLATLREVFGHVRVYWLVRDHTLVFLGSDAPLDVERNAVETLRRHPDAFAHLGVHTPEDVAGYLALDSRGTKALARRAAISTDAHNLFQFRAPLVLRAPLDRQTLVDLIAPHEPLIPPDPAWNVTRLGRRLIETKQVGRARHLAQRVEDPGQRATLEGMLAVKDGDRKRAVPRLREALRQAPESRDAWVALTRQLPDGEQVRYAPTARRVDAYPELAIVARAWERVAAADWTGLSRLDAPLADVPPGDPLHEDALRLRAWWRVEQGGPQRAEEALLILGVLLPISHYVPDHLLYIRALQASGRTDTALRTLRVLVSRFDSSNRHNALFLDDLETALAAFPEQGRHAAERAQVADELVARRLEFETNGERVDPLLR